MRPEMKPEMKRTPTSGDNRRRRQPETGEASAARTQPANGIRLLPMGPAAMKALPWSHGRNVGGIPSADMGSNERQGEGDPA